MVRHTSCAGNVGPTTGTGVKSRLRPVVRSMSALGAYVLASALGVPAVAATDPPADTSVYGVQPATFGDGVTPFPSDGSIWAFRQDGSDPITRLKFFAVPGFRNGLGRFTWRLTSFGKYVVLGNAQSNSIGGDSTDLRVGIFNSETRRYCDLIIDPQLPSSIPQIVTANPGARRSRILLASGSTPELGGAAAFGYTAADLDAPDPCRWPTVFVSAAQLNAGLAPAQQICPNDLCSFDTVALLGHEAVAGDPFGRDYVAVGEYFSARDSVLRVDADGIAVVGTYNIPLFATPGSGGACYTSAAARPPASDVRQPDTRPANDWRFVFSYDSYLKRVYDAPPPAECAPAYPYCPHDTSAIDGYKGAGCPPGGACALAYCAVPAFGVYASCTTNADCSFFGIPIGPCQTTCLQKNSLYRCRATNGGGSHRECLISHPDTCPTAGETCSPGVPEIVAPSQEYRFDKTTSTITPTSPMFFSAGSGASLTWASPTGFTYASDRSVWVVTTSPSGQDVGLYRTHASADTCTVSGWAVHVPDGEHCYYDPTNPATAVVVPTDQVMGFEMTPMVPYQAQTLELGGAMYFADTGSLQYAESRVGGWSTVAATSYKAAFAYAPPYVPLTDPLMSTALPAEPRRCSMSHLGCETSADCPGGETCIATGEDGVPLQGQLKFLEAGGSPKSLWVSSGYVQGVPVAQTDVFLERIPIALDLPDNLSGVRPSVAWDGDRLWLVAEHGGGLEYRVRDDGVWSSWAALAPNNITPVGGAAVIANGTTVRIYAHDSAGRVWEKVLTSETACAVGSCTWSSWTGLSSTVTTDMDVAATIADGGKYYVAVRNRANRKVYATYWNGLQWVSWFLVGNGTTDAAPSIAYHPGDNRVWVAMRQPGPPPVFKYSRIEGSKASSWKTVGGAAPVTWGYAPAIVSDGQAIRVLGLGGASPQSAWQIRYAGSAWSVWRKTLSASWGTRQPVATNINGEVELVTSSLTGGIQETLLP